MFGNWFKANKTLLILFSIITVIFVLVTSFQVTFLLNNLSDLNTYIETGIITNKMYQYGLIAGLNMLIVAIWFILFTILGWKILFPSYQSVKSAFCINELEFLIKMPTSLRKELSRKDEQQ